ncbi:PP2C family serine/threonine-protein phosphatase [Frankia sp. Cr2]|uniref:PP2C family serine/threonine-protein phosphatase n=1 Tax=Frankia sp. Cr2 TaxID=3073932 RepID=UPI002AD1FFED|nr:PP2C family serine/threonine-protein phosphatase [Frankia sp. Cr2]
MTWRVIARSEAGTSHIKRSLPCDDDCLFAQYRLPCGDELLAVVVADGAGSAEHGGEGAQVAIAAVAAALQSRLGESEIILDAGLAEILVTAAHDGIASKATNHNLRPRDFACTLLGVLAAQTLGTMVFQIGDGGIVLDVGNGLELAVVPMVGEYANMTHFVTQDNFREVLAVRTFDPLATKIAAFTDGLQRIALDLATDVPHELFFRPFFKALEDARSENEEVLLDQLSLALGRFLQGPLVNERTDDDKTLAIAVWLGDVDPTTASDELGNSDARA